MAAFEINLDAIPEPKSRKARAVFSPSPYQAIERDFAFVVDAKVAAGDIVRAAKGADRNLIESVSVFDVYEGKSVGEGKKSIAIAVRIQPKDKTLTEAEIEALAQKLVAAVTKATGANFEANATASNFGHRAISFASLSNSARARGLARWCRSAKMNSFFSECSRPVSSVTRTL